MDFRRVAEERKSVKKFSLKTPDWRKIMKAINIARLGPSAGNQTALKYLFISKPDTIEKIAQATQQSFVKKAPYIVVIVSDPLKLKRSYGEKAYRYMAQESGAAIENFLLALTDQKLATSWVGYFVEEQIKEVLEIPNEMTIEGVFPIGIEAKNSFAKQKKKTAMDNVVFFNEWNLKELTPQTRVRSDWS